MKETTQEEYVYELRIPKERIAVLIGVKGSAKKQVEELTRTRIKVDSTEGLVSIAGKDALLLYGAREMIRAIGRGFNPEIAQQLLKQDYGFEIITLTDYTKTQNELTRQKGRIIGEGGKSRKTIEGLTETAVCVYGKTVGIIGQLDKVQYARRAIEALLSGSKHASVYRALEKRKKEMKYKELI